MARVRVRGHMRGGKRIRGHMRRVRGAQHGGSGSRKKKSSGGGWSRSGVVSNPSMWRSRRRGKSYWKSRRRRSKAHSN